MVYWCESIVRISYVRGSEEDGARFWLSRVGWEPSEVAKRIVRENDPKETGYVADIGGAHGREALWLAEQGFDSILVEPNKYSLGLAKERAKNKKLDVNLIKAALPYLPLCSDVIEIVDLYWTLHQIPDEHKLESLKETYRILKPCGSLYSTSFGDWGDMDMPDSIYPVKEREDFIRLHTRGGFQLVTVKEMFDKTMPFRYMWWSGKFQKI